MEVEVWKCEPTDSRKGCGLVSLLTEVNPRRKYNCPQCGKRAPFHKIGVTTLPFDPEGK